uniref:Uncharacterized protein n=1 Tax=Cacopsylla melanoneura TaxID=428564 RepID=A0A8D8TJ70_9HEMI
MERSGTMLFRMNQPSNDQSQDHQETKTLNINVHRIKTTNNNQDLREDNVKRFCHIYNAILSRSITGRHKKLSHSVPVMMAILAAAAADVVTCSGRKSDGFESRTKRIQVSNFTRIQMKSSKPEK